MAKKKNAKFKSKLAIGFVFLIAVIYTLYHVSSLIFSQKIITIAAGVATQSETVAGQGYIFRDEELLSSVNTGVVDYKISDGEKVAVNQPLADVYRGNSTLSREMVKTLDRQISLLEKSEVGTQMLDLAALRSEANDMYLKIVGNINMGQTGELDKSIEQMTIILNKISLLSNGKATVIETLNSLRQMRAALLSGEYESETSKTSGYFYYYPDGYEDIFSCAALEGIDDKGFYEIERVFKEETKTVDKKIYGKIAYDSSWRFAISLPAKKTQDMEIGNTYRIVFPNNNNTELNMTLENKIYSAEKEENILILYCNKLPNDFDLERVQNAKIDVSTVRGIYIPRSALTTSNGVRGVYVLRGSVVYFRCVEIVYEAFDYCLASVSAESVGEFYALEKNELIITNGKNLFHGRILN